MIIDTHAHLNFPEFAPDLPAVIQRAREQGVGGIVLIGAGKGTGGNREAVMLAREHPDMWATVGVHPHDARQYGPETTRELQELLDDPKVVAVGELGLDFYRDLSPRDVQHRVLEGQLELAGGADLPVSIHCRDAHPEMITCLRQWNPARRRGVIHCFSGGVEEAREYISLGFLLGITGVVTYPKAERLRSVVREVGIEKLVLETDCPYLTPQPKRGRRNEPSYLGWVAEEIGRVLDLPPDEVARITTGNAELIFRLGAGQSARAGDPGEET